MITRPSIGAAVLVFTLAWFATLGSRALFDPDEGRYAEIPREMVEGGDWLIPHLDGLAYLEKPPLQYWLTAGAFELFGVREWSARLCTGFAGYASLLLTFLVGRRLWDLRAGVEACALLAASILFVLLGHQLTLDMLLSCLLQAALACFLLAQSVPAERPRATARWMLGCWAAMALAVLTKGLIGLLIPCATLLGYALWQRDVSVLERLNVRQGLPLFLLLAAPWFVLAARADPHFLQFFFVREHFQRYLTPVEHRSGPLWYFLPVLAAGILPWVPHALRALARPLRRGAARGRFDAERVLWVWCVFVVVFFSLSSAKLIPYVLPALPALAWLCAAPAGRGAERLNLALAAGLSLAVAAALLMYGGGAFGTPESLPLATALRVPLAWIAALLAVVGTAALAGLAHDRRAEPFALLCAGWFAAAVGLLLAAAHVENFFSAKNVALTLAATLPASAPVYTVQTYEQSLPFYLRRTVTLVAYRDEFALGLSEQPERGIDTLQEFSARWQDAREGYAVMDPATHQRLHAAGLSWRDIAAFPRHVVVSRR